MPANDEVDRIVDAWERERPDLDFAPLQVLSRVGRLARHLTLNPNRRLQPLHNRPGRPPRLP